MSQRVHITRQCGIYYLPTFTFNTQRQETWIPVAQICAKARISNYSANVVLTQTFVPPYNDTQGAKIPEAKYSFPVYPLSSVVSFVARIKQDDNVVKTIRGVVKSLPTAKKEYKEAVARGETAGFLEQVEDDTFTMRLGNIPQIKGTVVEVDVGYVTELKHDSEVDGIRFTIPTAIAPRYGSNTSGVPSTTGIHVRDGLEVNIDIDMPGPVTSIQSPSHPLAVTLGSLSASTNENTEFDSKLAFAKLTQSKPYLEGDFILQILCKDTAAPRAILEAQVGPDENVNSAALMLTFVPKFVIPPSSGPKKIRKEIIFMVDRSGSMYNKIDPLKSALKVFLKSLPPNDGVRFDICSFGSRYSFLFDGSGANKRGSKLYSQKTLKEALDHVDSMDANYGGTEILDPIKESCNRVVKRNQERTKRIAAGNAEEEDKAEWETEVLLLTDGEVWDTKPLFDLVRDHTQEWRQDGKQSDGRAGIRIFTLGIGRDVSHGLVEGLARAGGGYSMTVGDNERFEGKVVRMLKAALGERVGGYKLSFDGMEDWSAASGESSGTVTTDEDIDDFEMIDAPKGTASKTPAAAPAPISLFDTSANPDETHDTKSSAPTAALIPPVLIQAPHIIPPLFPFNRTTVFLLFSPRTFSASRSLPKVVTLKATTSGGHSLELSIPVTRLSAPGKSVHQLATKKYLDDLKAGESWIHSVRGSGKKLACIYGEGESAKEGTIQLYDSESDDYNEDEFEEIVKREGERIGVEWGVVGKWTAFVALEETSSGEKIMEEDKTPRPPSPPQYEASYLQARSAPMFHAGITTVSRMLGTNSTAVSASPTVVSARPTVGSAISTFGSARMAAPSEFAACASSSPGYSPASPSYSSMPSAPGLFVQAFSALRGSSAAAPISSASFTKYADSEEESDEDMPFALYDGIPQSTSEYQKGSSKYQKESSNRHFTSNADAAGRLIDLQDFEGYWIFSDELISCFWSQSVKIGGNQLSVSSLKELAKNDSAFSEGLGQDLKERILATCLVLVWFQYRLTGEKDTWELVAEKGNDWLTAHAGDDVDKVLAKAKEILEIA